MKLLIYTFILSVLLSCDFSTKKDNEECKFSEPFEIFANLDSTTNHSFEIDKYASVEKVYLPFYNMNVELYQSGCNQLRQEFRFIIQEKYSINTPPNVCSMHIAGIFYSLSERYPAKLSLLGEWAQAIKNISADVQYNEKSFLGDNSITMVINKFHDNKITILTVIFES